MYKFKKIFDIKEVECMLPLLKSITTNIIEIWKILLVKREKLNDAEQNTKLPEKEVNDIKHDVNQDIDKINGYIKEIEALGGFVEEFKRGIINFPALYNKRTVFLCLQPTEENAVLYFHEVDETYNDRVEIGTKTKPKMKNSSS